MTDCDHKQIQVIREGKNYVWSCALCGEFMLVWNRRVWEAVMSEFVSDLESEHLAEGEGFLFRITGEYPYSMKLERGMERVGTD